MSRLGKHHHIVWFLSLQGANFDITLLHECYYLKQVSHLSLVPLIADTISLATTRCDCSEGWSSSNLSDQLCKMSKRRMKVLSHQTKLSALVPVAMVQVPGSVVGSLRLYTHDRMAPVVLRGAVPLR